MFGIPRQVGGGAACHIDSLQSLPDNGLSLYQGIGTMVLHGSCGLLAVLFCGVAQAASSGLFLDMEAGPARASSANQGWWGKGALVIQPPPEAARQGFDVIERPGNPGARTGGRSFLALSVPAPGGPGFMNAGAPVPNSAGVPASPIPETGDPVPEPFGSILVPPVVGRRRIA